MPCYLHMWKEDILGKKHFGGHLISVKYDQHDVCLFRKCNFMRTLFFKLAETKTWHENFYTVFYYTMVIENIQVYVTL
jgi:hypothetical protein